MSIAFLQLGQCGNQLASTLFSYLHQQAITGTSAHQALAAQMFFHQEKDKAICNSVLVDMQPKVVNWCIGLKNSWRFDQRLSFCKQEGSGNNWAYGYFKHGIKVQEDVINRMRKLLQKLDYCTTLIAFQSMAGGTGSGLGSYLQQSFADHFPQQQRLAICVVPHMSGQVILQSYNAIFSLATLYKSCRGILLVQNDEINQLCVKQLLMKKPSLTDMNQLISHQIGSFLFPALTDQSCRSVRNNNLSMPQDLIQNLLYDRRYKLLNLKYVPQTPQASKSFSNQSWTSLQRRVYQMMRTDSQQYNTCWSKGWIKSIGHALIARGAQAQKAEFKELFNQQDVHRMNRNERSLCLVSNSQKFNRNLEKLLEKSTAMLQQQAFCYQYQKFGLNKLEMLQMVGQMEQVYCDYNEI